MRRTASSSSQQQRKRYAGSERRDSSEYKKEWSHFMSGVDLKRTSATGGGAPSSSGGAGAGGGAQQQEAANIKPCMDLSSLASSSFSYLFQSKNAKASVTSQAKQERAKQILEQQQRRESGGRRRQRGDDDDDDGLSKMVKAQSTAQTKGLDLTGMNRKERRAAMELTGSNDPRDKMKKKKLEAAAAASSAAFSKKKKGGDDDDDADGENGSNRRKINPKDFMDPKLQWYQQGPYPLDEITERLVNKKAQKRAKTMPELKLSKYNYQLIHPSWLAVRELRRKQPCRGIFGDGTRTVFSDDD